MQLDNQLQGFLGREGAEVVQSMVAAANEPKRGTVAIVVGVVAMILARPASLSRCRIRLTRSGSSLQSWQRRLGVIKSRLLSFGIVLAICFLLLVTMVVSAFITALSTSYRDYIPDPILSRTCLT